ncbi:MAG: prepilin-type N-terminal cleavage/methylation domain-containing protein [Pseudomonadota bacterium]
MNSKGHESGFTFIEMVVVISIISILLSFSIPLFRDVSLFSGNSERVSKLVFLIQSLKQKAVAQNLDFFLNIDIHSGLVWVTHTSMDEGALANAEHQAMSFEGDIRLLNLEFPGGGKPDKRYYTLCFRQQGYSDRALIHLREGSEEVTLAIRAFLTEVEWFDRYVSYDDCI